MARSTGPILAAGGITWASQHLFGDEGLDPFDPDVMRIVVGTGIAAAILGLMERPAPDLAVAFAWAALVTVLVVPVNKSKSTPMTLLFDMFSRK